VLLPLGWLVCAGLLAPARAPAPGGSAVRADPAPSESPAEIVTKVDAYFRAASATLGTRPQEALQRIPDRERHLLAVAHYLRRRHEVDSLWAWSAEQARAHRQTAAFRRMMVQVGRVRRAFTERNPGYVLVTDTNPRPLQSQLRYWNREPSVFWAARELDDSATGWLASELFPDFPDTTALGRFIQRVEAYSPARLPTVAVPGLSLHGQLRAFDFAVVRRREVVAGPQSASIDSVWDRGGWTARLRTAVRESGSAFAGPMNAPPEPWHYDYLPETP
jgi:hypothetical protein